MKGTLDRTKVVLRHLPPSITQEMLVDQIDTVFGGRYNWVSFRQGKASQKHQTHSRAYINFIRPEDVIEFAEFFNGHVFVNEKGAQYKTTVEYAPSQHVPKQRSKRDGREGTISKDPEYMDFLEFLVKPVENLPSAEVQLERREAERPAAVKDTPIVTPLMDFVRQKRASKGATRRSSSNGKLSRRAGKLSHGSLSIFKGNSEKRTSATVHVSTNSSSRDKSANVAVPKQDEQPISDKSIASGSASGAEISEDNSGVSEITASGKKRSLILKEKEKEIPHLKNVMGSAMRKQNHRHEAGGGSRRIVRSILVKKEACKNPTSFHSDNQIQNSCLDREKRSPRAPAVQEVPKDTNGFPEEKTSVNDLHGFGSERLERRTRNKDRPNRGVWAPLRCSDGLHASEEPLSSASLSAKSLVDSSERNAEVRILLSRRNSQSSLENGFHKSAGRRGQSQGGKDLDCSPISTEGKPSRRGGAGHCPQEKQVWVQKSSFGS